MGPVLINDMQTPPPSKLDKLGYLQFLFFEKSSILYSKFLENLPKYHHKWPFLLSKKMSYVQKRALYQDRIRKPHRLRSGHIYTKDGISNRLIGDLISQWLSHNKSKTSSLSNFPFLSFQIVIFCINGKLMKMFRFKFDQSRIKNK